MAHVCRQDWRQLDTSLGDRESEASLHYRVRPCLKKEKTKTTVHTHKKCCCVLSFLPLKSLSFGLYVCVKMCMCSLVCASVLIPHTPHMYHTTSVIQKTTSACPGLCCLAFKQGLCCFFHVYTELAGLLASRGSLGPGSAGTTPIL